MKWKQILAIVLISASTTGVTMWGYNHFSHKSDTYVYQKEGDTGKIPANYAGFNGVVGQNGPVDFSAAADAAIPATVHIKTKATRTVSNNLPRNNPFGDLFPDLDDFFGDRSRSIPQMASGSGAIISEDGFIVTNNHVVDGADDITVTLTNKKSFKAKLVASDPSSDLAVIKIEAKGLPFLLYGNSDEVRVGQWVLAVGYPLTLETTVTAGIVSAKGRTLEINRRQSTNPVESFIQTDAAVNPGNSGGPLINTEGKLIGINSAIASPTGAYAGYSFTIPVNIVKKIVADLMKFGTVQRAYLGIDYPRDNISDEEKKQNGIKDEGGVYVMSVREGGAASAAGVKKGDMITKINGIPVVTGAELVGKIATYSPGDKISITYQRAGKEYTSNITLRNFTGTTDVVKTSVLDKLGADLDNVSKDDAKEWNIKGGVLVKSIGSRGLLSKVRIQDGYVIIKANNKDVTSVDELRKVLENASGSVKIEGIYPGYEGVYPVVINLDSAN
ncbi:PDZ domain-containing protein [Niastella caeni]|uniref:PDZ domain-containing protein n=1 Tax=Niastella caeni TaxID=2569763 RepID=A0A4S8I2A1_9BACT|nr:trypsin-like peptidase domain-containing protein [Niastella caeni]THU40734.1 PDZ domain-containing protein [Niastella caeni]